MPGVRSYFVHKLLRARHWQPRPQFDEVCAWWRSGGQGVCSLIGIGGAGKTAIADRFLQTLPEVLPDNPGVPKDNTLPLPESVFVFSFYDSPNPEDFFSKLNEWLEAVTDSENSGASNYQIMMRLQDAPPSLLILDGLEKIQEDGTRGGIFGRIAHGSLRDFVTRHADGYHSNLSVLITSRFSLADLEEETPTHYRPIDIEEIDLPTGVHLLRARGVTGNNDQLESIVKNCGHHALTVDLAGGFLVEFHKGKPTVNLEIGSPEEIEEAVKSEQDPKRRAVLKQELRFARVAARYRQALQKKDKAALALLERVCLFRLGADAETLTRIFTGKGTQKVAGRALCRLNAQQLQQKLDLLVRMGLLEENRRPDQAKRSSGKNNPDTTNDSPEHRSARSGLLYTIHPAVRDGFLKALAPEDKLNSHEALRKGLEVSLGDAPGENPSDPDTLDLLEEIVHHTLQSGHVREAWDIYENRIGGYGNLGWRLGAYERGDRICRGFADGKSPENIPILNEPAVLPSTSTHGSGTNTNSGEGWAPFVCLPETSQAEFIADWAMYLTDLGRLVAGMHCFEFVIGILMRRGEWNGASTGNRQLSETCLRTGRLSQVQTTRNGHEAWRSSASTTADEAMRLAELHGDEFQQHQSVKSRAAARSLLGHIANSLADFRLSLALQHIFQPSETDRPLYTIGGVRHTHLLTRLGRHNASWRLTQINQEICNQLFGDNDNWTPKCHLVLSLCSIERSGPPPSSGSSAALWTQARDWALDRDAKEVLCWSCLVEAQHVLAEVSRVRARTHQDDRDSAAETVRASTAPYADAHSALEAGLKIARNYGFGLYHIDLLLEWARLHLLRGDARAALDDVEMALGDEEGGGGIPANEKTGQPELLAARNVECGYAWPVPFGLQLRAEALLLQAAQEIGDDSFVPAKLSGQSDTFRQRIEQAKENLAEAMDLWQPLHDPEPERPDQNFQLDGTEYNYRAEETHRILTDLEAGLLTRYPLVPMEVEEEQPHSTVQTEKETTKTKPSASPPKTLSRKKENSMTDSYIVFCRLVGLDSLATDQIAGAVNGLNEILDEALAFHCTGENNGKSYSSVFGRFGVVPGDVTQAIEVARSVIRDTADNGIHVAIGIAAGPLEGYQDLDRQNIAAHAINTGARIAFYRDQPGWVGVEAGAAQDARDATARLRDAFTDELDGKVKKTEFKYRQLLLEPAQIAAEKPVAQLDNELAHVAAYDIAGYSGESLTQQARLAETLRRNVDHALQAAGGSLQSMKDGRCYSPGGDGGVLVFRSSHGGARAAWTFAKQLRLLCQEEESTVPLRIGLASGVIVVLKAGALPVGQSVFYAEKASGLPENGQICSTSRYWEKFLEPADRGDWSAAPSEEDNYLILTPETAKEESGSGQQESEQGQTEMTFEIPGTIRLKFIERLGDDWRSLATVLEIKAHIQNGWDRGDQGREILQFLENRKQLHQLPAVLKEINRHDLAELITNPQ